MSYKWLEFRSANYTTYHESTNIYLFVDGTLQVESYQKHQIISIYVNQCLHKLVTFLQLDYIFYYLIS